MSLTTGKRITRRNLTEMSMTEDVMKQIKKWVVKDSTQTGLTFKNKNGEEYEFGEYNNKDKPIACPKEVPFPDIPAEANIQE
jgi:hypothetical protein